jgi:glutamyl/glutaminyl-tRNA synthetase
MGNDLQALAAFWQLMQGTMTEKEFVATLKIESSTELQDSPNNRMATFLSTNVNHFSPHRVQNDAFEQLSSRVEGFLGLQEHDTPYHRPSVNYCQGNSFTGGYGAQTAISRQDSTASARNNVDTRPKEDGLFCRDHRARGIQKAREMTGRPWAGTLPEMLPDFLRIPSSIPASAAFTKPSHAAAHDLRRACALAMARPSKR